MKLSIKQSGNTTFHYITTKQFKTVNLHIRFIRPLDKSRVTCEALLQGMLRAKNAKTKTRKNQSKLLESLYDATFSAQTMKLGMQKIEQYTLSFIHDDYTLDEPLTTQAIDFLANTFFAPSFDEETLSEEKQFLNDYFLAEYANKNRYAYKQYIRHLYEGHPYNIEALGYAEEIDSIGLDAIKACYQALLNESAVTVSLTGDFDPEVIHEALTKAFPFNSMPLPKDFLVRHHIEALSEVKESGEVSQDRLFMTLDTKTFFGDADYFTALVYNSLLGENSDSLLFKTVRETRSLAYYVHSSFIPFTGIITVSSGMDKANIDEAKETILSCVEQLKTGDFDAQALKIAKTNIITSIKQSYDNSQALSLKALRHSLLKTPFEEDYVLGKISSVTHEEVVAFVAKIKPIFTYVLGGETA